MGRKQYMLPAKDVDISTVKYHQEVIAAPRLSGYVFKLFGCILDMPVIGPSILSSLKRKNKVSQTLHDTFIPERPMFEPEFPSQEQEDGEVPLNQDALPVSRVASAVKCLQPYDVQHSDSKDGNDIKFLYWRIRDYAHAYRSRSLTPSIVAERIILAIELWDKQHPSMPWTISFCAEELRREAAASTQRFQEEKPLSLLDGIFMPIKDDIDCLPYPTKGGTTWIHKVRTVREDATCVTRLRECGVIFIGKANMHELGLGVTGNNPNYGIPRNPYAIDRYTGGSSSGPAAIVASGLCPAALGTDGGGSIRIPSSLCGVVGLKATYGRIDMTGSLCEYGTVVVVGPLAATVEDTLLVYSAILGPSDIDSINLNAPIPRLPCLHPNKRAGVLKSLKLGKYSAWFNDVPSEDISNTCTNVLNLLSETYGCSVTEITLPELHEMRTGHIVSFGSDTLCGLNPDLINGNWSQLTLDSRTNLSLFQSFSATDYVAAQCLRRRIMHYHMEAFKNVDVIVTPTTGVTAPVVPSSALAFGESNLQMAGNLMRFVIAANFIGLPAISVPVGHDMQGLPIGLQLVGRPWGEASILRVASAVEELCESSRNRPSIFFDILNDSRGE